MRAGASWWPGADISSGTGPRYGSMMAQTQSWTAAPDGPVTRWVGLGTWTAWSVPRSTGAGEGPIRTDRSARRTGDGHSSGQARSRRRSAGAGGDAVRGPLGDEITKSSLGLVDLVDADRQDDLVVGHADSGHEVDVDAGIGEGSGCRRNGTRLVLDTDGDDRHLA